MRDFASKLAAALGCAFLAACASVDSTVPATAIVGATVVHPERDATTAAVAKQTIVIAGDRIVAIGDEATTPVPRGARVVDAHGKWVIPGMVDAHVHFFQSGNLYTRPDAADFNKVVPYAKEMQRTKDRLTATFRVWLASGVTSVIDIGGPMWNFDMRDIAARTVAAPRVEVAGPLISMISDPPLDLDDPPIVKIGSPEESRELTAKLLAKKPDFIKVWFIYTKDEDLPKQEAIVKAAGDMAHAAGVRLAVHATELATAKAAMRAGADYLVHSVTDKPVDDEFLALARRNHIVYCPTIFVFTSYGLALSNTWHETEAEKRLADPQVLAMMHDLDTMPKEMIPARVAKLMDKPPPDAPPPAAMKNLITVWNAGIPVAMGTDAGNIGALHGPSVFREMDIYAQAGLTPVQVLRSATVNGAKALGREKDLGTLAAGKLADLVVLDADPLASTANLSRIDLVVKDGNLYSSGQLIQSIR